MNIGQVFLLSGLSFIISEIRQMDQMMFLPLWFWEVMVLGQFGYVVGSVMLRERRGLGKKHSHVEAGKGQDWVNNNTWLCYRAPCASRWSLVTIQRPKSSSSHSTFGVKTQSPEQKGPWKSCQPHLSTPLLPESQHVPKFWVSTTLSPQMRPQGPLSPAAREKGKNNNTCNKRKFYTEMYFEATM